jgi:hypothetical protein
MITICMAGKVGKARAMYGGDEYWENAEKMVNG